MPSTVARKSSATYINLALETPMIGKSSSYPPYFHTWQWKFKRKCLDVFPTKTTTQKGDYQRVDLNDPWDLPAVIESWCFLFGAIGTTPWHLLQMTRSTGRARWR
jgi:hypothetical protein